MKRVSFITLVPLLGLPLAVSMVSCTDPVLDQQIAALGPEQGSPGPDHRPGQPCVLCHSEFGTASGIFTVAGTVFETPTSPKGVQGVQVLLRAADNSQFTAITGPSGNFQIRKNEWDPPFPLLVQIYKEGVAIQKMQSHIGREPSCATCHFNPPNAGVAPDGRPLVHYKSFQAVGQIYLKPQ